MASARIPMQKLKKIGRIKNKMTKLVLKNFYRQQIHDILQNKKVAYGLAKIFSHEIFFNDYKMRIIFTHLFLFKHPFFLSKIFFLHLRVVWLSIMKTNFPILKKIEIWKLAKNYLKLRLPKISRKKGQILSFLFSNLSFETKETLLKLINELNKVFLLRESVNNVSLKKMLTQYNNFGKTSPLFFRKSKYGIHKNLLRFFKYRKTKEEKKVVRKLKNRCKLKSRKAQLALSVFKAKAKEFRVLNLNTTAFLVISLKLNNIFFTAVDFKGKTLYQCSGGYYKNKGQNRVNPYKVFIVVKKLCVELKRMRNIKNLILISKNGRNNKLVRFTIKSLKKYKILRVISEFLIYNRPTTYMRKKKVRRV